MNNFIYMFGGNDGENGLNDLQVLPYREELKAQDAEKWTNH